MSEYECTEHLLDEIQHLREANFHLRKGSEEQKQRIKQLEEAGDEMERWCSDWAAASNWLKAKEDKL